MTEFIFCRYNLVWPKHAYILGPVYLIVICITRSSIRVLDQSHLTPSPWNAIEDLIALVCGPFRFSNLFRFPGSRYTYICDYRWHPGVEDKLGYIRGIHRYQSLAPSSRLPPAIDRENTITSTAINPTCNDLSTTLALWLLFEEL